MVFSIVLVVSSAAVVFSPQQLMDRLETVVSDGAVEQPFREFVLLSSTDREAGVKLMKLPSGECADLPVR